MGILDKLTTKKPTSSSPPPYTHHPTTTTTTTTHNNNNNSSMNPYPANPNDPLAPTDPNSAGGMRDEDERALPAGWEKQWHEGYGRYFYINTRDPSGPRSHWIHPLDQSRTPPPAPTQPPPMGNISPQNQFYTPARPLHDYSSSQQPPPPQQQQAGYMNQQPMYQQQQFPMQAAATTGRRAGGVGMNPLLAGAGGLAGGMLLGSMLESHHEHQHHGDYYDHHDNNGYTDGYQQGYDNGYANGFDAGDDFGDAGDFGGFDDGGFF